MADDKETKRSQGLTDKDIKVRETAKDAAKKTGNKKDREEAELVAAMEQGAAGSNVDPLHYDAETELKVARKVDEAREWYAKNSDPDKGEYPSHEEMWEAVGDTDDDDNYDGVTTMAQTRYHNAEGKI